MGPRNYDVDANDHGPRFALPVVPSMTKTLLWLNILIGILFFLIADFPVGSAAYDALALAPDTWRQWFPWVPVWQLGTYGFLHSLRDPTHLLFNMLGLYFFGTLLEGVVGPRRLLVLYLTSIVLGGAVSLAASLATGGSIPTVGASGGVLFLVIAMAVLQPNIEVVFFIFPLKLRTLALIMVGMNLFNLIQEIKGQGTGIAVLVHLTGAAFGFAAVKLGWIWYDPLRALAQRRERRVVEDARSDEERLDQLLQQIHERGIGSLSKSERDFLKRMSSRNSG